MVYWISVYRNASENPEIHIHYLKNPGRLDSTHICVCMILQKTIQYVPDYEIVDILAKIWKVESVKLMCQRKVFVGKPR